MTDSLSRREFLGASGAAVSAALAPAGNAATAGEGPPAPRMLDVSFQVNGRSVSAHVEARVTLLDYLRERMTLTGTKKGCNEGACGACTVLVDGQRMNGCMILVAQCEGRAITTVEGIAAPGGALHAVQRAFIDHDAFQCGFCTPGQIVSAVACIAEGHASGEATVREWMSGNLCRCSAYPQITAAVLAAAQRVENKEK